VAVLDLLNSDIDVIYIWVNTSGETTTKIYIFQQEIKTIINWNDSINIREESVLGWKKEETQINRDGFVCHLDNAEMKVFLWAADFLFFEQTILK
jgi:Holliday junction resolvase